MTEHDVKGELRRFILASYLPGESPDNLRDTTPLQTSGILDSLAVLSLADFIKQRIEDMAALVVRKTPQRVESV
jgi:hypothetical protein